MAAARLTPEVISRAPAYLNPLGQRELGLRGLLVSAVENLGVTEDQYECLDLTHNQLVRLDGFPLLRRLVSLLLSHNRVERIGDDLGRSLPSLVSLVMDHNKLARLQDLDPLGSLTRLTHLSLVGNPVAHLPRYRLYVVHLLPQLKALDYQKVRPAERLEAKKLFGAAASAAPRAAAPAPAGAVPAAASAASAAPAAASAASAAAAGASAASKAGAPAGLTAEQKDRLRRAIEAATSLAEVTRLEAMLASGKFELDS